MLLQTISVMEALYNSGGIASMALLCIGGSTDVYGAFLAQRWQVIGKDNICFWQCNADILVLA